MQQVLAENDIAYDVLVEDMQKQIEQENSAPETIKQLQRKNGILINIFPQLDSILLMYIRL